MSMMGKPLSKNIDKAVKEVIQDKLQSIIQEQELNILYACESGSRAWGFPSPDSDYDVRFIYIRSQNWYLSIQEKKDMLQFPINDELDIVGWDIRKLLRLFRKSNATPFEWLQSPIIYQEQPDFRTQLWAMAADYFVPRHLVNHYLGIARNSLKSGLDGAVINIKKYFYVLRPLLAARWILNKGGVPPLEFVDLLRSLEGQDALLMAIEDLWQRKLIAKEGDKTPLIPVIQDFIYKEIEHCNELSGSLPPDKATSPVPLNMFFQDLLKRPF